MKVLAQNGAYRLIELPAQDHFPAMWRSEVIFGGLALGTCYWTEAEARADYEVTLTQAQVAAMLKGAR